jgi:PAS domain S-box-containing protein
MNASLTLPAIRVLLVDDDRFDRLACQRVLAQYPDCEFLVVEAETGQEGLHRASTANFDCILLDYRLPDLDGAEFLTRLTNGEGYVPIPVIMLTGTDSATVAVDTLKLGACDYVLKESETNALQWLPLAINRALREQQAIRDKIEAVERLREAEAKYRTLVEQIPAITYIASLTIPGKLLYISPQISRLGIPSENWLENSEGLLKRIHPDDRERMIEEFAKTHRHHTPLHSEYRLVSHDGRARWFLDKAQVVRDDYNMPLVLQGILVDITDDKETEQELYYYRRRLEELVTQRTEQLQRQSELLRLANANMDEELFERKRAEAALRVSGERFHRLLDLIEEGILEFDAEGRCLFINDAALSMLGYEREELLGQNIFANIYQYRFEGERNLVGRFGVRNRLVVSASNHNQPLPNDLPSNTPAFVEVLKKKEDRRFTTTLCRKDGNCFPAECIHYPVRSKGWFSGVVVIIRALN